MTNSCPRLSASNSSSPNSASATNVAVATALSWWNCRYASRTNPSTAHPRHAARRDKAHRPVGCQQPASRNFSAQQAHRRRRYWLPVEAGCPHRAHFNASSRRNGRRRMVARLLAVPAAHFPNRRVKHRLGNFKKFEQMREPDRSRAPALNSQSANRTE